MPEGFERFEGSVTSQILDLAGHVMALKTTCALIVSKLPRDVSEEIRRHLLDSVGLIETTIANTTDPAEKVFHSGSVDCYRDIAERAGEFGG